MRQSLQSALDEARTLAPGELPRLIGELAEVNATALARLNSPAPPTSHDELLEVRAASARLGLSQGYLYRHHAEFPFTRHIGRRLLFSASGMDEYINRNGVLTARRQRASLSPSGRQKGDG